MRLILLWGCLLLPGSRALTGPKEISGFEGDTVTLQCSYKEEMKEYLKYWCKSAGIFIRRCSNTIYSREDGREVTSGRVSIQDSPQDLTFTVTLRDLTLEDKGKYWCGIQQLGFDHTFAVSLIVFPGPCCPSSPSPSSQLFAIRSLQPKARAWQPQPRELTSPGLQPTVTTAKQGKTGPEASAYTGTSMHTGPTLYTRTSARAPTSPPERTSFHTATSPHTATSSYAGSSRLATQQDSALTKGTSSSKSRMSVPMIRILSPVLVLLGLLLAASMIVLGSCVLRHRKKEEYSFCQGQAVLMESLLQMPGNGWTSEYAVINRAGTSEPAGPCASHEPSAPPDTEIHCLNQTTEEAEAAFQDPQGDEACMSSYHLPEEEPYISDFIPV
ncbi:PREDICTED: CMRF35-like molecule 9 [Elephantulus edwardii]|uniref:CMRF35-like molecule 9 n=1 Tax=Elephantulus edwardii TaxID=28737 RepID=UPI0003F08BC0|nr:PREDICTED: CMRF35-like molecule 9 [Elephantulus edwardii]